MTAAEHIDRAFELLSRIPVAGSSVDLMALARNELTQAGRELSVKPERSAKEAGPDGG